MYTITLTATNIIGNDTLVAPGLINATGGATVPVADFGSNVTRGTIPLAVRFEDRTSGLPLTWNWSFGDGNYSDDQNPVHVYNSSGNFDVSLYAANELGNDTRIKTGYINAFQPQTFFIDAFAGPNGTIAPSGHVPVDAGTDESFAIVPDANFSVLDVSVDGVSKGPLTAFTFPEVMANHTIAASFIGGEEDRSIPLPQRQDRTDRSSPKGKSRFPKGRISRLPLIPAQDIRSMTCLSITGRSADPVPTSSATLRQITASCATFGNAVYVINATAGDNGTISPNGTMIFSYGDNQTFTIDPATGYRVQNVIVDGQPVGTPRAYAVPL